MLSNCKIPTTMRLKKKQIEIQKQVLYPSSRSLIEPIQIASKNEQNLQRLDKLKTTTAVFNVVSFLI